MSDDELVKYLLGEATEEESEAVKAWMAAAPVNARYYRDFKTIWDESRKLAASSMVDVDAAWNRFEERRAAVSKKRSIVFPKSPALRIAAGIALLIAVGSIFFFFNKNDGGMLAIRNGDTTLIQTLPDGSVVTLNKHAELQYPKDFSGGTRTVILNGEAFFEVVPDKAHPFIITANEASVRVLGTSFNVKSTNAATEVIVATGVVEVSRQEERLQLMPNEATTVYHGRAGLEKRKTDDALYNYYRTQEFVCNNTPLSRLADIISEAYNVQIEMPDPAVGELPLTVTFRNESLPEVLRVISETLAIRVEQEGNRIIFKSR